MSEFKWRQFEGAIILWAFGMGASALEEATAVIGDALNLQTI